MSLARERMGAQPLYERVLGEDWHRLNTHIRGAHLQGVRMTGKGSAQVITGNSLAAKLFCKLLRLPKPGEFDATVEVDRKQDSEIWTRRFGRHIVRTKQDQHGSGQILERFRWMQFTIAVERHDKGVTYCSKSAHLRFGLIPIPIPKHIQPRIDALESATGTGNRVNVSVFFPANQLLISYIGEFEWSAE